MKRYRMKARTIRLAMAAPLVLSSFGPMRVLAQTVFVNGTDGGRNPAFDVISVKVSDPNSNLMGCCPFSASNFVAYSTTLETLIGFAYNIPTVQVQRLNPKISISTSRRASPSIIGGPEWIHSTRFDISAKSDSETLDKWKHLPPEKRDAFVRSMVQAMLADRFALTIHRTEKLRPVYTLVVSRGGSKLISSRSTPEIPGNKQHSSDVSPWHLDNGSIRGRGVSLGDLASMLWIQPELENRRVIDKTGLDGTFDITLLWTPELSRTEGEGRPGLFTAIQEQLGLRLQDARALVDVLVVDSVTKPSAN